MPALSCQRWAGNCACSFCLLICAGPQPRRVGLEASRSGRPHGGDRSRTISKRKFAARCATRKTTREKSYPSLQSHRSIRRVSMNLLMDGLILAIPLRTYLVLGRTSGLCGHKVRTPRVGASPPKPYGPGRGKVASRAPPKGISPDPDGYTLSLFPRQGRGRCKSPLSFAPVLRQARDDPGKGQRDVAIDGHPGCRQVDHDPAGHAALLAWRGRAWAARRTGIEASGRARQRCQTAGGRFPSCRVPAKAGARAMFRRQRAKPSGRLGR